MGQLSQKGLQIVIHNGVCTIENRKQEIVVVSRMSKSRLFPLNFQTEMVYAFSALVTDPNWLWHF